MDDLLIGILVFIIQFLIICGIFAVLAFIARRVVNKIKSTSRFKSSRFLNPREYLPDEEIVSMKQVFYLIMIVLFTMNILYMIFSWRDDSIHLLLFDLIISIYLTINLDMTTSKGKIIFFSLIPLSSFSYLLFPDSLLFLFDVVHIATYIYFIRQYYHRFMEFSEENSLGIAIMLLFLLIFVSFFITLVVENVSPLDSLSMVSNAFTSNGYSVLGKTGAGKLNSLFLVWSGFILSSVGTATLTVAIVMRHVNGKFDRLEDLVRKNKKN